MNKFCVGYEEEIRRVGGVDLQILGIGTDGHIGFNEPGSSLASRTRIKTLTKRTRSDNARFFGTEDQVPHHVITMGVGTIMEAKTILLLAFGSSKAEAVAGAVEGPITASNPASVLQHHPETTAIIWTRTPLRDCNGRTIINGSSRRNQKGKRRRAGPRPHQQSRCASPRSRVRSVLLLVWCHPPLRA